jgi:hypothetical protein
MRLFEIRRPVLFRAPCQGNPPPRAPALRPTPALSASGSSLTGGLFLPGFGRAGHGQRSLNISPVLILRVFILRSRGFFASEMAEDDDDAR